jgi:hypothetical protein
MPQATRHTNKVPDEIEIQPQAATSETGEGQREEDFRKPRASKPQTPNSYRQSSISSTSSTASSTGGSSLFSEGPLNAETPPTPPLVKINYFHPKEPRTPARSGQCKAFDNSSAEASEQSTSNSPPFLVDGILSKLKNFKIQESPTQEKHGRQQAKHKKAANGTSSQDNAKSNSAFNSQRKEDDSPPNSSAETSDGASSEYVDSDVEMIDVDQLPQTTEDMNDGGNVTADDCVSASDDSNQGSVSSTPLQVDSPNSTRGNGFGSPTNPPPPRPSKPPASSRSKLAQSSNDQREDQRAAVQPVLPPKTRGRTASQATRRDVRRSLPVARPQSTGRKVSAPPNLTSHDEAQAVETAPQSQVLEAPSAPSDNEELHEEQSALMSGALDPSISGDHDAPSPSPEIIHSPEDVPAAQWPILPRKNEDVLSAKDVKNNILDLVASKNKSKKESDWNPLVALIRILQTPKWVLQPLGIKPPASLAGDGYIYIFKSAAYPGYVKIGVTRRNPNARKKEWELKCKFKAIHIKDPNDHRFWNSRIVERLVHTELYNEQRIFKCAHCKNTNNDGKEHHLNPDPNDQKTKHGEWFEITETRALEVVNKWRNWAVTYEPYSVLDTPRPFWVDRCEAFMENENDDLEGFFTIDRIAYEGFISRSFKNAMRFVAPVLLIALTSPSFVWVPGYIFFRFGFGLYGWGILLLVCLSFSGFMWKYF